MIDADYTNGHDIPAYPPALVESELDSLEKTTGGIGLYVNANKTEFMCLKQKGAISTLNGKPLGGPIHISPQ